LEVLWRCRGQPERAEIERLIEDMPDDQVTLAADTKRLPGSKPRGRGPKFVGRIKDGPSDGSTARSRGGVP
jgi:hypothetical protein